MNRELEDALDAYWSAAFNEAKYELETDEGKAQDALNRIRAEVGKIEARVAELEAEIKRRDEADAQRNQTTLNHLFSHKG